MMVMVTFSVDFCCCCQEVTVIRLQAAEGDGPYSQLFSYLSVRNRCGVVSSWGLQVKDLYIVPLSANSAVPSALLPFSGPGACTLSSILHYHITCILSRFSIKTICLKVT